MGEGERCGRDVRPRGDARGGVGESSRLRSWNVRGMDTVSNMSLFNDTGETLNKPCGMLRGNGGTVSRPDVLARFRTLDSPPVAFRFPFFDVVGDSGTTVRVVDRVPREGVSGGERGTAGVRARFIERLGGDSPGQ